MALFTIADLHLSFGTDKPMDVFGGRWANYTEKLNEHWRYMISENDTVIVPGDISWAMNLNGAKEDFAFLDSLPGKKIVLKGNHDYWWNSSAKFRYFLEENSFESITFLKYNAIEAENKIICGSRGWMCEDKMTEADNKILKREALRFGLSLAAAEELDPAHTKERLVFSHYPVCGAYYRRNPIMDVLTEAGIKRVFYGHLHGVDPASLIEESDGISLTLVSSDHLEFAPMKIV